MESQNSGQLKKNLDRYNWKDIEPKTYVGVEFDLTASRKVGLFKQTLLIKYLSVLDEETLSFWLEKYEEVDKNPKKLDKAQSFTLCIVAETITEKSLEKLSAIPFKNFGSLDFKGGKGISLIVDVASKTIYGRRPGLSKPFKRIYRGLIDTLKETYDIYNVKKVPKPELFFEKMKSVLKSWGIGLIIFGALHIVFSSFLDPIWGVILIVVGLCNIVIPHRVLFLVNGFAIMTAAIFNGIAMGDNAGSAGILVMFQFIWGVFEIRNYNLYDEAKQVKK